MPIVKHSFNNLLHFKLFLKKFNFKIHIFIIIFQRKSSYTAEKFTYLLQVSKSEDLNLPFTTVDTNLISEIPM